MTHSSYQMVCSLVRFDYRGDRDERTIIVASESTAKELEDAVSKAITKFRKMLDVEQGPEGAPDNSVDMEKE